MIDLSDTKAIYARARKAYAAGELQAQQENTVGYCSYKGPCAIGVYMTESERSIVEPNESAEDIHSLLLKGVVEGDLTALEPLQEAHDDWNNMRRNEYNDYSDEDIQVAENVFVAQLERY